MAAMSREPDMNCRVQYPSIPELKDGLEELAGRYARKDKMKFRGRKLRPGPLHNAVLLHFLMLPEAARKALAEKFLKRYEELLQFDEPQEDLGSIVADHGDSGDGGRVVGFPGRVVKGGPKPKRKHKTPKAD